MANTDGYSVPPTTSLRPKMRGDETATFVEAEKIEQPLSEVSLAGLALVGALLAFFVFRLLRKKRSDDLTKAGEPEELPPMDLSVLAENERSKTAQTLPTKQPAPFDNKTSEHLQKPKVVCGTAWVTDGDTIVIDDIQIRLFGIDAPELDHPYGQKAKWAMVKLCKGQTVRAEITDVDHYGRTVAHCTLPDGRDLSAELVKMGLAIDWPKFSGGKYASLEIPNVRKKLWLADARQKGRMYLWEQFQYEKIHRTKAQGGLSASGHPTK